MLQAAVLNAAICPAYPLARCFAGACCAGSCSNDVKMLSVSCSCSGKAVVVAVGSVQFSHLRCCLLASAVSILTSSLLEWSKVWMTSRTCPFHELVFSVLQ